MKLSKYFTLAEMTATAVRGVDNTPSLDEVENLRFLCVSVLDPLRQVFGPLYTTSGYRSPEVNRRIGGSPTSAHQIGCAWDGVPLRSSVVWSDVIRWLIQSDLPVDQVIYEYGRWIHVGTKPRGERCRRQALMIFEPGVYETWNPRDSRVKR